MSYDGHFYFKKTELKHRGGTKSYTVLLVGNSLLNTALVVFRWGKVGNFGDVQVIRHNTGHAAGVEVDKKITSKGKGGYDVQTEVSNSQISWAELVRELGPVYVGKIGREALHVNPTLDVSKVQGPSVPRTDENGNWIGDQHRGVPREALLPTEEERQAQLVRQFSSNPTFGMF